jgi:hypothetical protein
MGKQEFDEWMVFGKDGVDSIRERLAKNGLRNMKRDQVVIFCKTLVELKFDTTKEKMRAGRDRVKAINGKCEGRHPYGSKAGEAEILEKMKELCARGKKPDIIARELNIAGVPTRGTKHGKKPWRASTVSKILSREGLIKPQFRPKKIILSEPMVRQELKAEPEIKPIVGDEEDKEFWLEIEREVAKGPLPKSRTEPPAPKQRVWPYVLKETRNGRILVPTEPLTGLLSGKDWHKKYA